MLVNNYILKSHTTDAQIRVTNYTPIRVERGGAMLLVHNSRVVSNVQGVPRRFAAVITKLKDTRSK